MAYKPQILTVPDGGTGVASTTAYAVLCGGTTSTGPLQSIAGLGSASQVLTSNGAGALPTFQDAGGSGGITWNEETTTSVSAAVNNGYITNNAAAVTVTLPGTFAVGDTIAVVGKGAGGWVIDAPAGDTIRLGSSASSSGGTFTSTNQYDCVELVGTTANDTWTARSSIGNITIA